MLYGWNPSTSFDGSMRSSTSTEAMCAGRGAGPGPRDRGIGIQPVDQRKQLRRRRSRRQVMRDRDDAGFLAGAALVAHVDRGGGVVADHHDGKPRPAAATALERIRPGPNLAPELLCNPLAIDDLGAQNPAALLKSPSASTRTATASRSAAVRCGFQTSMIRTTRVRMPRFQASCS